jgi:DNA polymerase III delta prime subunit
MEKFFNTAGPIRPEDHYHIPLLSRLDWEEIQMLMAQKKYFLLHAPRQTGKTSTLLAIMHELNSQDKYACVYANIEAAQAARNDVNAAIRTICQTIAWRADMHLGDNRLYKWLDENQDKKDSQGLLTSMLSYYAKKTDKLLILLLDEVDALVGDSLVSVLRQLRSGYDFRPDGFPASIAICGIRDIKDYRIHTSDKEIITGGSAFNIKAKSVRMGNFSYEECRALLLQHTEATGQTFDEAIFPKLWTDTYGQPWLVNALGYQMTMENRMLRNRSIHIQFEHYMQAREELIQSRATHLDQLTDKLREDRVRILVANILANEDFDIDKAYSSDDQKYVEDLGLITLKPGVRISNDIYKEIIPREITWISQTRITNQETVWYLNGDNTLNMPKLLRAFQQFFRENADSWIEKFDYKEAGPQLLLQAFLQRILNGGGRINREYALGRKRTDIFIEWPTTEEGFFGKVQKIVIETKILRSPLEQTITEGIAQTKDYAQTVGAEEMHLIIFDRKNTNWDEKIWEKVRQDIRIWGA